MFGNEFKFIGNLTRDPENKMIGETHLAMFTVAVNDTYKNSSGEKVEDTTFINCDAWGTMADRVVNNLSKGDKVLVTGKLKQDNWEDQDGNKRSTYKVRIDNLVKVQFLSANPSE